MTYIHYCLHNAGPVPALLKWAAEVYSWAVKQPTLCTKYEKCFTKGVRNHSREVFVNQYWKCSCECRSVLEVLLVGFVHAEEGLYGHRPRLHKQRNFASRNMSGIPCLQFASAWKCVQKTTPILVSVKIVSSVCTVLTTTMLT